MALKHPQITRRSALAILARAPLAAAVAVSPAPLTMRDDGVHSMHVTWSNIEKLQSRLAVMRGQGMQNMHVTWGPLGLVATAEERAGYVLEMLDAPAARVSAADIDGPLRTTRAPVDVRELVNTL